MKFYSGMINLKFTWDQVAQGLWQRYPNPYSGHVLSEDTVERYVTPDKKLVTKRIITKANKLPKLGEKLLGCSSMALCVVEESIMDLEARTIVTYTRNIGMQKVMSVQEKCMYQMSPENNSWTRCHRQAWVSSNVGYGVSYAVQTFGFEKFKQSAVKTVKGFEHVLNRMFTPPETTEKQTLYASAEKVKAATKKAKELAKAKAVPVMASYTGGGTAS